MYLISPNADAHPFVSGSFSFFPPAPHRPSAFLSHSPVETISAPPRHIHKRGISRSLRKRFYGLGREDFTLANNRDNFALASPFSPYLVAQCSSRRWPSSTRLLHLPLSLSLSLSSPLSPLSLSPDPRTSPFASLFPASAFSVPYLPMSRGSHPPSLSLSLWLISLRGFYQVPLFARGERALRPSTRPVYQNKVKP